MLGVVIFATTLTLIVTRPRGIPEMLPALLGGLAMLPLGLVTPGVAVRVVWANSTLLLFFLGLMTIAHIAEEARFFERVARLAVTWSHGSPRRLLVNIFLAGAAITAILSNDATALVLTSVVYVVVTRLHMRPLPYVFACKFVADAASFLLPVSNPVNQLLLVDTPIGLGAFLSHLLAPEVVILAVNLGAFLFLFRRDLQGSVDIKQLGADEPPTRYFSVVLLLLACIAVGYVVATVIGTPVGFIAAAGGLALVLTAAVARRFSVRRFARGISWTLFPFIVGMLVLVKGIEHIGITAELARGMLRASGGSSLGTALVGTASVALGANLINNVPMALVARSAIGTLPAQMAARPILLFASVIGADLGPNINVAGSLATMLWLLILRRRGVTISSLEYLRIGATITIPALLAGSVVLWITFRVSP